MHVNEHGVVLLYMIKQNGGNNPGEKAGYLPHIAERLISEGFALPIDPETGEPLSTPDSDVFVPPVVSGSSEQSKSEIEGYEFNELTDPFLVDGLTKNTSMDLHKAGLHTPDAVKEFVAGGKTLKEIKGITTAEAKKITVLYLS